MTAKVTNPIPKYNSNRLLEKDTRRLFQEELDDETRNNGEIWGGGDLQRK